MTQSDNKIRVGLLGADGNMGIHIGKIAADDPEVEIVCAYTIKESPNLGKKLGELLGHPEIDIILEDVDHLEESLKEHRPDIVIDFTVASGTEKNAPICIKNGVATVIGTTGMADRFYVDIEKICSDSKISAVVASNMATGVNVFFKIAAEITKYLKDWDIEIIEAHHHRKRDSPSGTALTVAKNIAKILDRNLDDIAVYGRSKGPNPRKIGADEIGIHSIRAGDIVGDHIVLYAGPGERIELVHRAHSRECFASGAVKAAKFLAAHKNEGKVFDMQDVLGL